MTDLVLTNADGYELEITPLKTGGRADVRVPSRGDHQPEAFSSTDIVGQLRVFFDRIDVESEHADPIALVNALARMEALSSDVRTVTSTIRKRLADQLSAQKVRRLTVEEVATVEGTSEAPRTDWEDKLLFNDMLDARYPDGLIDAGTGERVSADVAFVVNEWARLSWRLTPIKEAGLNPDDYSTQAKGEDGKPLRTPTIRMHDNSFRKEGVT